MFSFVSEDYKCWYEKERNTEFCDLGAVWTINTLPHSCK